MISHDCHPFYVRLIVKGRRCVQLTMSARLVLVGCSHHSTNIFACAFLLKSTSIHPLTDTPEMTSGPKELKVALQRLIDGTASEADRDVVRTALNAGVLVAGKAR